MYLLAESSIFWELLSGFLEGGSRELSNGTNVASSLNKYFSGFTSIVLMVLSVPLEVPSSARRVNWSMSAGSRHAINPSITRSSRKDRKSLSVALVRIYASQQLSTTCLLVCLLLSSHKKKKE
jgi:hypothetical protein